MELGRVGRADDGVELDLDDPALVEQPGDDHHRARRADRREVLAVSLPGSGGDGPVGDIRPGAHDIGGRATQLTERRKGDLPAAPGLDQRVGIDVSVRPHRSSSGDGDAIADADSPAEADRRFVRGPGGC